MSKDDAQPDGGRTDPLAGALDELGPELDSIAKGMISVDRHGPTQAWAKVARKMMPVVLESAKLAESLVGDLASAIAGFDAAATRSADAANAQAKKLTWATWVLAGATVVLAVATVALVWTTAQ